LSVFRIGRVTCPRATEKAFDGFYLSIAEGIVLRVPDHLVVGGCQVIERERVVSLLDNGNEIDLLNQFGLGPASLLVEGDGDVVIGGGAGEGKPVGQLARGNAPIFLFVPGKVGLDDLSGILGLADDDYGTKHRGQ